MSYRKESKPTSNTSPRSKYGGAKKPKGITIHHWGSDGQQHDNVVRWLRGRAGGTSNRGSSAHEVISAGRVTVLAPGDVATWHAGNNTGNGTTIGLECRPEMSDGDWQTLVERCADLEEQWGSLKYYRHKDWKSTACPGRYSSRIGELVDAVNAEHARRKSGKNEPAGRPSPAKPKPKAKPAAGKAPAFPLDDDHWFGPESSNPKNHSGYWKDDRPAIKRAQQQLKDRGWNIKVTGRYDQQTYNVVKAFQKEKGMHVDGGLGSSTWPKLWTAPIT